MIYRVFPRDKAALFNVNCERDNQRSLYHDGEFARRRSNQRADIPAQVNVKVRRCQASKILPLPRFTSTVIFFCIVLCPSAETVVAPTLAEWTIKPTGRTARQRRRRRKRMAVRVKSLSSRDDTNCPRRQKCQGLRRRQPRSPAEGSCAVQRCKLCSENNVFQYVE